MSEHLDLLLAELGRFRTTVQRLVDDVLDQQAHIKAFQEVLVKKGLVTRQELAQASAEASRQVKQGAGNRPGHRRRGIKAVRKTNPG